MNKIDLNGRVAVVTGGAQGFGRAITERFVASGAKVAIWDHDLPLAEKTAGAIGDAVKAFKVDVSDLAAVEQTRDATLQAFGKIDILVNNAGCNIRKPAMDVTWDDWNTILDTNLRGSFFVAQAVARGMIQRGYGRIINIGSVTSVAGFAGLGPYTASRGGIKQLTMSLADDWGRHGVTVNCLAPGWFKTRQNQVLYENAAWVEYITDRIPAKRPGRPDDLDGAVVFLASESSRYVTGQTLLVDGGVSTGATKATV